MAASYLPELHLPTRINDEGAKILETGLVKNVALVKLQIRCGSLVTDIGWQSITTAIPRCKVESLIIQYSLNDTTVQSLSNALLHHTTLKSLDLFQNEGITAAEWVAFSNVLWVGNTALEKLDLNNSFIGDLGLNALTNAITNNSRLRKLDLWRICGITTTGWVNFSVVLCNPILVLERLDLRSNSINNGGVAALANALVNNNRLKELDLGWNLDATIEGWGNFSTILHNPNSALEKLCMRQNPINSKVMISFVNAMGSNSRLRDLDLCHLNGTSITSDGWEALTRVLWNNASILSTFTSNHTLQIVDIQSF